MTKRDLLRPGTVYVVPANRHVEIEDDHVAVSPDGAPRPKPSVEIMSSRRMEARWGSLAPASE